MWYEILISQLQSKIRKEDAQKSWLFFSLFFQQVNTVIFLDVDYDESQLTFILHLIHLMNKKYSTMPDGSVHLKAFSRDLVGAVLVSAKVGNELLDVQNVEFLNLLKEDYLIHCMELEEEEIDAVRKELDTHKRAYTISLLKVAPSLLSKKFNTRAEKEAYVFHRYKKYQPPALEDQIKVILMNAMEKKVLATTIFDKAFKTGVDYAYLLTLFKAAPLQEAIEGFFYHVARDYPFSPEFDDFVYDVYTYYQPDLIPAIELGIQQRYLINCIGELTDTLQSIEDPLLHRTCFEMKLATITYLDYESQESYHAFKKRMYQVLEKIVFNPNEYPDLMVCYDKIQYATASNGVLYPQASDESRPLDLSSLNFVNQLDVFLNAPLHDVLSLAFVHYKKNPTVLEYNDFKAICCRTINLARLQLDKAFLLDITHLECAVLSLMPDIKLPKLYAKQRTCCRLLNTINQVVGEIQDDKTYVQAQLLYAMLKSTMDVFLSIPQFPYQTFRLLCEDALERYQPFLTPEADLIEHLECFSGAIRELKPGSQNYLNLEAGGKHPLFSGKQEKNSEPLHKVAHSLSN
ncbi:MAG: hypothetical protein WC785_07560 [Tatlockia sp.]|jgi:hypothetical protein